MKIINEAISVLTNPKEALKNAKNQKVDTKDIIFYLAIVGIPTLLGYIIGYGVFWFAWGGVFGASVGAGIAYYIIAIIGIIFFGYIFNALAQNFKSKQNQMLALKLVSYAATPWLLAGIFFIIPAAWFIAPLGALYGLYILYLGIPVFMETPKDQQIPYLIVAIIIYAVIMAIAFYISRQILWNIAFSSAFYRPYF
jgi:hypothetical protein